MALLCGLQTGNALKTQINFYTSACCCCWRKAANRWLTATLKREPSETPHCFGFQFCRSLVLSIRGCNA